jgi:hypothetical protein
MYHGGSGGGTTMKFLALFSVLCILLLAQGCTSLDQSGAGVESSVASATSAPSTSSAPASDIAVPTSGQPDPAANGGSSLPASAPYTQDNSASVPQNVNATPFLAGGQTQGAAPGSQAARSSSLTSRADGTMMGPNDLPAATTGWGAPVSQPAPTGIAGKKATAKPKGSSPK